MPSHHRIKNIDYDDNDDDDYYSYDDEEDGYYYQEEAGGEHGRYQNHNQNHPSSSLDPDDTSNSLSPDDRNSLRNGTVEVRQLLRVLDDSANSVITDGEIWSALWEFYYDVDASVEWLRESATKKKKTKTTTSTATATATIKQESQKKAKKQTTTTAVTTASTRKN
ncbi:hypothetical protein KEM54_001185, partial [Ascosphaera aggregata]